MYSQHASRAERPLRAFAQHGDLAALQLGLCMPSGSKHALWQQLALGPCGASVLGGVVCSGSACARALQRPALAGCPALQAA